MISIAKASEELATSPKTNEELYFRLRDYTGRQVSITHCDVSRTGELCYLSYNNHHQIFYILSAGAKSVLVENCKVEVKLDETWKVIYNGEGLTYGYKSNVFK